MTGTQKCSEGAGGGKLGSPQIAENLRAKEICLSSLVRPRKANRVLESPALPRPGSGSQGLPGTTNPERKALPAPCEYKDLQMLESLPTSLRLVFEPQDLEPIGRRTGLGIGDSILNPALPQAAEGIPGYRLTSLKLSLTL